MSILISIFGRVLSHGTASNGLKIILGIVLFYTYKYRSNAVGSRRRFDLKEPKGAVPLLGHLPVLASMPFTEMCQFFEKQNNELGPVWSITLPGLGRPIQIDTPENLEHVLKTNFTNYGRGQLFKDITWELGGNSLFTSDGAQWKFQRHIGNGIFHVKAFQEYVSDALVVEGKKVLDILGKAADEGTIVDMQKLMLDYTIDVFGSISFGGSFGCLDNIEKKAPFVKAFEDMLEIFGNRLKDPTWKIREQPDGTRKRAESNKMFLRGHAQEIINKRRREGYSAAKKDLLQLLMEGRDDAGEPLPDDLIVDNIIAFTVAGRDTTAQALTWMFYSILRGCSDPEIIKNLVKEVDEVFDGSEPTHETYRKQKYAEACFYEEI
ncbi:hypothetical protein BGX26_000871 [Mortierella sp. AD094]|nr:hypothetical protein BGX26_000871 [Mortierella sp. AD094]